MLPYSVMSYFSCELASLGIPIFMPSPTLLAEWQKMYHILQERKSDLGHKDTDFLMQNTRSFNRGYTIIMLSKTVNTQAHTWKQLS